MAEQKKTKKQVAEEWLAISIENWQSELKRLKIGSSEELFGSFHGQVITNAANSLQVEFAYAWYGQMVDGGWGRGTKVGDERENATMRRLLGSADGHNRKPKPWYTKGKGNIAFQTRRLGELIAEVSGDEAVQRIANSINLNHIIRLD